jgi:hypothetical protein
MVTPSSVTSKLMSSKSHSASYHYLFLTHLPNSNKSSLAVVEDAFDDLPEDDEEASSKDADPIPSTEVEGCEESLRWLKREIAKRVSK